MRSIITLALALTISTTAAWAVVEAQVAGDWKSDDGTYLQVNSEGKYKKITGGGVVETGTLTALDGKWSLRSDAGRLDSGSFSVLGGQLTLRSMITSTTTWQRSTAPAVSSTAIVSTPPVSRTIDSKPLQSSVSMNTQQQVPRLSDNLSISSSYPPPQAVVSEPPPRRNRNGNSSFKDGFKSFKTALQRANQEYGTPQTNAIFGGYQNNASTGGGRTFGGGGGGGHGTYSEMRKAFDQEQLSSLPPPRPINSNPQGDETSLYGVGAFESRARGPAVPVRIKVF